jgi:hypothetical protein
VRTKRTNGKTAAWRLVSVLIGAPILSFVLGSVIASDRYPYGVNAVLQFLTFALVGSGAGWFAGRRAWIPGAIGVGALWVPVSISILVDPDRFGVGITSPLIVIGYVIGTVAAAWFTGRFVDTRRSAGTRQEYASSLPNGAGGVG